MMMNESVPSAAEELTARLRSLRATEREVGVDFLLCLGELDRRKLYLELGFSSAYEYCLKELRLSNSSTYRRLAAARLLAQFPHVADYLRDGRLCPTTLVALRDILDEERLTNVLERAAGRTEEQVKELVAALRPRPAPQELFPVLPVPVMPVDTFGPEVTPPPAKIEPVSEELRVLRVTVTGEFTADLEKVKSALSHQVPSGRLDEVLHLCLKLTLKACAKRRRGRGKRYIPAEVHREVWRRDQGRCAFVAENGHRCNSTYLVQIHHIVPDAMGGPATVENLSLRCAAHNRWHAEQDFPFVVVSARLPKGEPR